MTCRSEQKLTILVTERPVLQIHGNSVGGLVLESERNIELDPVFLLISCLHLFQSLLEQRLELRRYREDDIGGTVRIPHILLSLDKMLRKCSTAFVSISVETDNALRLGTVAQSLVCQHFLCNILSIIRRILRLTEH